MYSVLGIASSISLVIALFASNAMAVGIETDMQKQTTDDGISITNDVGTLDGYDELVDSLIKDGYIVDIDSFEERHEVVGEDGELCVGYDDLTEFNSVLGGGYGANDCYALSAEPSIIERNELLESSSLSDEGAGYYKQPNATFAIPKIDHPHISKAKKHVSIHGAWSKIGGDINIAKIEIKLQALKGNKWKTYHEKSEYVKPAKWGKMRPAVNARYSCYSKTPTTWRGEMKLILIPGPGQISFTVHKTSASKTLNCGV